MSSVESRIVTMKFENSQFLQGISSTLSALGKLKSGMNLGTAAKSAYGALSTVSNGLSNLGILNPFKSLTDRFNGFNERVGMFSRINPFSRATDGATQLGNATGQVSSQGLTGLANSTNTVSAGFIAMSTVAITALSNITTSAMHAGANFLKSFTFAPIMQGLSEYETNLKSMQTIQANTDRPLSEVEDSLDKLNEYSDQTIYNFSEMARNVGTFTAAGVDLKTSVSAIKGIANVAALSGSSSEQAATAMYQLSQAIAAGKVGLMDWNSVVNAGMGGKKLQNALAQTAVAMGELDKNSVKTVGSMKKLEINGSSFRESIMAKPGQESWLSSEALVNTLAAMDGRFSEAALAAEKTKDGLQKYTKAQIAASIADSRAAMEKKNGVKYTDEQFKALQEMSTAAFKSATEVKTLGQVWDILKETIGSGWSASFRNIFGGLNEAKETFTAMKDELGGIIEQNALARNKVLNAWKEGGGRATVIEGIKNAWEALLGVLGPIQKAFRDVFPAKTADDLIKMSNAFENFTKKLIPSKETMEDLQRTFRGVFAIFSIIGQVIGGVAGMFGRLFGAISGGSGGFLEFTGGIGDFLFALDRAIEKGGFLTAFFNGLGDILAVPLNMLRKLASAFGSLFEGFGGGGGVGEAVSDISNDLEPLAAVGERVKAIFSGIGSFLEKLGSAIVQALATIGEAIVQAFSGATFDQVLDTINTGLFAALTGIFANFAKNGIGMDFTGGLFDGVTETLGAVTGTLKSMQTQIKADIIIKIAIALALLTASIFVLSTIDGKDLAKSLAGMSAGFAGLSGALVYLSKAVTFIGLAKLPIIAAAMIALAASLLILSVALKIMSTIDGADMAKSLIGLAIGLKLMTTAVSGMSKNSGPMLRSAITIGILAVSLNILAVALKILATMSWEEMAKGLAGLAGALGLMVLALNLMPKSMELQAAGLLALGGALLVIAIAMRVLATMSIRELATSLVALSGALLIIVLAINSLPKSMMLQAAALVVVAGALVVLAGALKIMGSMSWEAMAKGLVMLGGALLIIGIGLKQFGLTAILGATALAITAAGLNLLIPLLVLMGAMSWESIIKGLVGLAGVFVVLGVAGYLLAPVTPIIMGLSLAILAIGAGFLLAGAGALMLASAFGIFVGALVVGGAAIGRFVGMIIKNIPKAFRAFGNGIVEMARAIGRGAQQFFKAFNAILTGLLRAIIKNAPLMARAFLAMLTAGLRVIVQATPKIVNAGLNLIVKFLQAISKNIGKITNIAADIIVKFLNGISRNIGRIIQSGVNLIIKFVNGVSKAIDNNSEAMGRAGGRLAVAIVRGMANGISAGAGAIKDAAIDAAKGALSSAMSFLGINSPSKKFHEVGMWSSLGMAEGISTYSKSVSRAGEDVGKGALSAMKKTVSGLSTGLPEAVDFNPTIKPVLDLSEVARESAKMGGMLATDKLKATASFETALRVSNETNAAAEASSNADQTPVLKEIKFEQTINSPKALDPIEVYRDTRNQLALAKEALSNEGYEA